MQKFKNCSRVCAYHCAQLSYTTQHRAVLIIFPLILQASTRAQMLSTGGEAACYRWVNRIMIAYSISRSSIQYSQLDIVCEMLTTMLASMIFGSVQSDSIKSILMPRCFVKYS